MLTTLRGLKAVGRLQDASKYALISHAYINTPIFCLMHNQHYVYKFLFLMIPVRGPHQSEALGGCLVCLCLRLALCSSWQNSHTSRRAVRLRQQSFLFLGQAPRGPPGPRKPLPWTSSATRPDTRTKSVHVEIERTSLRPDKVCGLVGDPRGPNVLSGPSVEFGLHRSTRDLCRAFSDRA